MKIIGLGNRLRSFLSGIKRREWIIIAVIALCLGCWLVGVGEKRLAAWQRRRRLLSEGRDAMMCGRWNVAIDAYSQVLEISPKSLEALDQRGDAYEGSGQMALAMADYWQAITLKPQGPRDYAFRGGAYLSLRNAGYPSGNLNKQAEQDFAQAITMKVSTPFDLLQRGMVYIGVHKLRLALDDFSEAIKQAPNSAWAFYCRGYVYAQAGKGDLAVLDYTRFIKGASNGVLGFNNRGYTYFLMNKYDLAMKDLDEAVRLAPDAAIVWNVRGRVRLSRKQYDLALGDFNRALSLDHKSYLFADRARLYFDWDKDDLAMRDLDEAIREDPKNIGALILRIACRISQLDFVNALEDCNEVLRLDPRNVDGYEARMAVYGHLKRDKDAAQDKATFNRLLSAKDN